MTSILPLVFVVKQAYEDWLRHRQDKKVNNAPAMVLRNGHVTVSMMMTVVVVVVMMEVIAIMIKGKQTGRGS